MILLRTRLFRIIARVILPLLGFIVVFANIFLEIKILNIVISWVLFTIFFLNFFNERIQDDGKLVINMRDPLKDVYSIQLSCPINEIEKKEYLALKVVKES